MDYAALLKSLTPEVILTFGALVTLAHDILSRRDRSHNYRVGSAAVLGFAAVAIAGWMATTQPVSGAGAFIVNDGLAAFARLAILMLSGATVLLIGGTSKVKNPSEQIALTLFATAGFTLMTGAQDLLTAFLAFELSSLTLYILAGFDKTSPASAEAGLKYFLFGGTAAAFMLFGFSLIYGLTGGINFSTIAIHVADAPATSATPLFIVALLMVFVGFGYKAAAAPFHVWAPDAYQGAPATSAALIASASKVAGFTLLARFLTIFIEKSAGPGFAGNTPAVKILALLIVFSLLLGNFAALAQKNLRRLVAYSAISHAGILLLAALMITIPGIADNAAGNLLYYLLTYGVATVGIFGVIAVVENNGGCQNISDLRGLSKRSPLLAVCLMIFVLSLSGIPPLAGFYAKFSVFYEALTVGSVGTGAAAGWFAWLAILGIAMSVLGLYYYLVVLKAALIESPEKENATAPIRVPAIAGVVLAICAGATILFGVWPALVLRLP